MNNHTATQGNASWADATRLMAVIEEFRKLDPEIQAQQIAVFLAVVATPDLTMRELEQRVGLSGSSVSRNVAALGAVHRRGQPGHGMIATYEDVEDRRVKRVRLTHKGKAVFGSVQKALGG